MGEIIRVRGPVASQLIPASADTLVNNIEITVRQSVNVAMVQAYTIWVNDTVQASEIHDLAIALNGVAAVNTRDRRSSRAVVGGLNTNYISGLLENLVAGDVVRVIVNHAWAGLNNVLMGSCDLRVIGFGPEIRAQGIFEDTG